MNKIRQLTEKVIESEDILQMITKYQVPISEKGYNFLVTEVQNLKTELIKLEAEFRIDHRRKILMN